MLSSNLLKSKIPMLRLGGGGREVGGNQFSTFDTEFIFAKIQNSHVEVGWGGGGRLVETNFQLLMLSPNLLKTKMPCPVGRGGWWNQFPTFDAESKFAKKKNFCEKCSKFSGKKVPGNGFGLWVPSGSRIREPQQAVNTFSSGITNIFLSIEWNSIRLAFLIYSK